MPLNLCASEVKLTRVPAPDICGLIEICISEDARCTDRGDLADRGVVTAAPFASVPRKINR